MNRLTRYLRGNTDDDSEFKDPKDPDNIDDLDRLLEDIDRDDSLNQPNQRGNPRPRYTNSGFDPMDCLIPTVYCGDKDIPPRYKVGDKNIYKGKGTRRECFTKGFGAGMYSTKSNEDINSLQSISYVGEQYEKNFKKLRPQIINTEELAYYCKVNSKDKIKEMLRKVLVKKNNIVDEKAYNSVLMYLYDSGITKLPDCVKLY